MLKKKTIDITFSCLGEGIEGSCPLYIFIENITSLKHPNYGIAPYKFLFFFFVKR